MVPYAGSCDFGIVEVGGGGGGLRDLGRKTQEAMAVGKSALGRGNVVGGLLLCVCMEWYVVI